MSACLSARAVRRFLADSWSVTGVKAENILVITNFRPVAPAESQGHIAPNNTPLNVLLPEVFQPCSFISVDYKTLNFWTRERTLFGVDAMLFCNITQNKRFLPEVEFPLNKDDDGCVKILGIVIPETNAWRTGSSEARCGGQPRPRIC